LERGEKNLLNNAVDTENEAVILFWCKQREFATPDELQSIGSIESALNSAINMRKPVVSLLIAELAEQRCRLKALVVSCLPKFLINFEDDRLLDGQANEMFDLLLAQNIPVHNSLRPCQRNIYYQMGRDFSNELSIEYAEALYEAGFRDITAVNTNQIYISPLQFHALNGNPSWCDFLVTKGAKWTEQYPGVRTTAVHVLGQAMGDHHAYFFRPYPYLPYKIARGNELLISRLFLKSSTDSCCCGCCRSGCVFISAWIKGATESKKVDPRDHRILIYTLACWSAVAVRISRWVVSALIRSLTFWKLGIRHTCCNIKQIPNQHWFYRMEQWPQTIKPQYSPEVLQEILEEDAFLLSRLEQLVALFDAQYDSRREDIVEFIMGYWSETMLSELEDLARADHEKYGEGRRHLGIELVTNRDERSKNFTLETGLTGKVNLDTQIHPTFTLTIRDIVPTIHTLDELDEIFHECEDQISPPTSTS
jgi:hypothetical protein